MAVCKFASAADGLTDKEKLSDFEGPMSFEGPEKLLEIWFASDQPTEAKSLRDIPDDVWQKCLDEVNCKIINKISNEHVTAYLLSESSMFVYPDKVYIKTCGTTTLLRCIKGMVALASSCGLNVVEDVFYSRQDFFFPDKQLYPHGNFSQELSYLTQEFKNGSAYILGKVNGDHYNFFNAEARTPRSEADSSLEVMMTGLDETLMRKHFYKDTFDSKTYEASGVGALFPGALVDEFVFDPCGYSMNGIVDDAVFTIHITPEPGHSYASFECNVMLPDYTELLAKVLRIFNPKQFMVVGSFNHEFKVDGTNPMQSKFIENGEVPGYQLQDQANYRFQNYKLSYQYFTTPTADEEIKAKEQPMRS